MDEAKRAGDFMSMLSNRPELLELLEDDMGDLVSKVSELSTRVDKIEERGQLTEERVLVLENRIGDVETVSSEVQHLKKQMEDVQAKLLGRKIAAASSDGKENFKGNLQIYTQQKKFNPPEYDSVSSSNNGW